MTKKATILIRMLVPVLSIVFFAGTVGAQVVFAPECDEDDDCDYGQTVFWDHPGLHGLAFGDGDFKINPDDFYLGRGRSHLEVLGDKTLSKMERDARELARDIRTAENDERDELESRLDEKLAQIFDYKNDKRRRAIEANEKRLNEMRQRLDRRESARDDIIEQRKDELLGTRSYLDW